MFISKNLIDNPNQRPVFISTVMYQRAISHYRHFDENNLWYVDEGRNCSHVFFDGQYCVEVSPKYVRFLDNIKASDFQIVDINGTSMIRHKRSIKPLIYHPTLNQPVETLVQVKMTPSEELLFTAHPELVAYCVYNRCCGWTVDMCNNTYPLVPGASVSIHTRKIYDWFKSTHNIINLESKAYRRRVCSARFTLA